MDETIHDAVLPQARGSRKYSETERKRKGGSMMLPP
jgi:hypothetical protein